jgi:ATP-dependent Lon protease
VEVNEASGSGMRITNVGAPGPLRESVQTAYQNLLARNRELIGDRDARQHELNVQVRAMDAPKSGALLGVPLLLAFCSALLAKSLRGGLVIVGGLSVGGSFEPLYNAVSVAELAVEKGDQTLLLPLNARRQMNDLSDEMAAKLTLVYYLDVRDGLLKALAD